MRQTRWLLIILCGVVGLGCERERLTVYVPADDPIWACVDCPVTFVGRD